MGIFQHCARTLKTFGIICEVIKCKNGKTAYIIRYKKEDYIIVESKSGKCEYIAKNT